MAACAQLIKPLYGLIVLLVLPSKVLSTDDTRVPRRDPQLDRTRTAYFWAYVGDDDLVGIERELRRQLLHVLGIENAQAHHGCDRREFEESPSRVGVSHLGSLADYRTAQRCLLENHCVRSQVPVL